MICDPMTRDSCRAEAGCTHQSMWYVARRMTRGSGSRHILFGRQDDQTCSYIARNFGSTIYHHRHRISDIFDLITVYGTDPIIITSSHDTITR